MRAARGGRYRCARSHLQPWAAVNTLVRLSARSLCQRALWLVARPALRLYLHRRLLFVHPSSSLHRLAHWQRLPHRLARPARLRTLSCFVPAVHHLLLWVRLRLRLQLWLRLRLRLRLHRRGWGLRLRLWHRLRLRWCRRWRWRRHHLLGLHRQLSNCGHIPHPGLERFICGAERLSAGGALRHIAPRRCRLRKVRQGRRTLRQGLRHSGTVVSDTAATLCYAAAAPPAAAVASEWSQPPQRLPAGAAAQPTDTESADRRRPGGLPAREPRHA